MIESKNKSSARRRGLGNVWSELDTVCRKIHIRLYKERNRAGARRFQRQLESLLGQLPENDLAILREEGTALLHELKRETSSAIEHRKREIRLMERLQKSVRASVANGEYDGTMGASILAGRDAQALQQRRAILQSLERQQQPQQQSTLVEIASRRNHRSHSRVKRT